MESRGILLLRPYLSLLLLLPDDQCREYDAYRKMVKEVNRTQVEPEEVLSYGLYRYNRKNSEIEEIVPETDS